MSVPRNNVGPDTARYEVSIRSKRITPSSREFALQAFSPGSRERASEEPFRKRGHREIAVFIRL